MEAVVAGAEAVTPTITPVPIVVRGWVGRRSAIRLDQLPRCPEDAVIGQSLGYGSERGPDVLGGRCAHGTNNRIPDNPAWRWQLAR